MGEINNASEEEILPEGEDKGTPTPDENLNKDGAGDEAEGADNPDDVNSGDGDEADDDDKSKSKPTLKADEEPKTRKRNIDFINERKARKAEKDNDKGYEDVPLDEGEDDGIDPNDAKIIQKQVAKVLSPFLKKQMQDEDNQEIGDFVKQNPDFAPYAETVKKYAQHPTRRDMPIKALFYEVAGDDLLKIGAKRAKKADDLARESGAGGGQGGGSEKGVWDLTPEEFATQQEALRNKPRE